MDRYKKQRLVPEIGDLGQSRLQESHVTIVGCGGLGSIVAPYLAGAGVGTIFLIDSDVVELDNLHRQVFFTEKNLGQPKAEVLYQHLTALNSDIKVEYKVAAVIPENIHKFIKKETLVIECTDNLSTKYLINDYCAIEKIPMIYGSLGQTEGQVAFFHNELENDCHLRDIYPKPLSSVETCNQAGVMNTIAGIIGLFQANEAIKFLTDPIKIQRNKLLIYRALISSQYSIKLTKNYTKALQLSPSHEIDYGDIKNEIDEYRIISLLPEHELPDNMIINDFSTMKVTDALKDSWETSTETVVFFCQNGSTSKLLVQELNKRDSAKSFLSLKNGIQALIQS